MADSYDRILLPNNSSLLIKRYLNDLLLVESLGFQQTNKHQSSTTHLVCTGTLIFGGFAEDYPAPAGTQERGTDVLGVILWISAFDNQPRLLVLDSAKITVPEDNKVLVICDGLTYVSSLCP